MDKMNQKNNPNKQSIKCIMPLTSLEYCDGHDVNLPPNETYTLDLDLPWIWHIPLQSSFKTGKNGMGLGGLFKVIWKAYDKAYAKLLSDSVYSDRSPNDIVIERIEVDHKRRVVEITAQG